MRRWFVALGLVGLMPSLLLGAPAAFAGEFEMPTLRGSAPFVPQAPRYARWSGFYAGGQMGYSSTRMDFSGATEPLISFMLRELALEEDARPSEWQVLRSVDVSGPSWGGFIGYNSQWDDVIVGIELHYNKAGFRGNAPASPISRLVSAGGNTYAVTVDGDASMRITDFGVARLRGGWIAGNFLPYATVGLAVGRADVSRTARVFGAENPPAGYPGFPSPETCGVAAVPPTPNCTEFNFTSSESKKGAWIVGWAMGGGIDVLLTQNIFLRAEVEYVAFTKVQDIEARMTSARVGAGIKF